MVKSYSEAHDGLITFRADHIIHSKFIHSTIFLSKSNSQFHWISNVDGPLMDWNIGQSSLLSQATLSYMAHLFQLYIYIILLLIGQTYQINQ